VRRVPLAKPHRLMSENGLKARNDSFKQKKMFKKKKEDVTGCDSLCSGGVSLLDLIIVTQRKMGFAVFTCNK